MKKVLTLLLAVMMMACVAFAEETTEELPEINFRGATLGTTLAEVKDILECNVRNGNRYTIYSVNELLKNDLIWIMMGDKDEKAANVFLADEEMFVDDVAGYSPIQSFAFFVRPVENGALVEEKDRAVFYAGVYLFEFGTEKGENNYRDILGKLTSIYGEPISENGGFLWQGANQTAIHLTNGGAERTSIVRLSYLWTDAQQMIDDAYAVVADEPAVDNSTNTNGL